MYTSSVCGEILHRPFGQHLTLPVSLEKLNIILLRGALKVILPEGKSWSSEWRM